MSALPPEVEASYIVIIDEILRGSDLNIISAKRIRKGLQAKVDDDISGQKEAIDRLIYARFDKISAEQSSAANATSTPEPPEPAPSAVPPASKLETNGTAKAKKRSASASSDVEDEGSDAAIDESSELSSSPPKKKHKKSRSVEDTDAQIAARMQAEEYSRARSTRGGGAKRKAVVKKPKKKKSKAKVTDDLDSDAESGEKKEVNRTGGFHKPMNLSPPLSALLNETQLSRPQTVKRIWEYIKAHDLQDPNDKRQIRCDDNLRSVFKTDKIHMFTMNKVLNQNLYAIDE